MAAAAPGRRARPRWGHAAAALLGASALAPGLCRGFAGGAGGRARRGGGAHVAAVARRATAEEALLTLCSEFPGDHDQDDMDEVRDAIKKLPDAPENAFGQVPGVWKVLWDAQTGRQFPSPTADLRLRPIGWSCFDVMPTSVSVGFVGRYNRVQDETWEDISVFKTPGSDAVAALVLSGSWGTGSSSGEWGEGAARLRCSNKCETVRVALPAEGAEAAREMLEAVGLAKFLDPVSVDAPGSYVDLKFTSPELRVQQSEAGIQAVLAKMAEPIPFILE